MKIYQVDAFAKSLFEGNPAAVVPLDEWLPDPLMQNIAMENNLAETAFLVPARVSAPGGRPAGADYEIRWFTPTVEVDLCGHATLASGHVLFEHLGVAGDTIVFHTRRSGDLRVTHGPQGGASAIAGASAAIATDDDKLTLDFPAGEPREVDPVASIFDGLRIKPRTLYRGAYDFMVVMDSREAVVALEPDFSILGRSGGRGVVVTAKDDASGEADFVSRCFYPQSGIDEDPVTGSAHTMMVPYWARALGKTKFSAIQLSRRRGYLDCELRGDRVLMSGYAKTYLVGEIFT